MEYDESHVTVTDILYEKRDKGWVQKISSYRKIRIYPSDIIDHLKSIDMNIVYNKTSNKMITIIAEKKAG